MLIVVPEVAEAGRAVQVIVGGSYGFTVNGAAHAACFSMALSGQLGAAGLTAERIETHAEISLEKVGDGFEVTASHLDVTATIPGADEAKFQEIAERAKSGCPLSKVLRAKITMDARLSTAKG